MVGRILALRAVSLAVSMTEESRVRVTSTVMVAVVGGGGGDAVG
jgi:hypothetical protein